MNWINNYCDLSGLDIESLIMRFSLSTAEVEGIERKGEKISGVVVGEILSVEKHPDSKKLHLLKVDAGSGIIDIVCGAPNVREGMKVPVAVVGATVGEITIREVTLAGYPSHGMCCSAAELGISSDNSGLLEIDGEHAAGTDIKTIFDIDDTVFEVDNKSLTNRPDLWGHYGIAREFSALSGRPLLPLETLDLSEFSSLQRVKLEVVDRDTPHRYTCMRVDGISAKATPENMKIRLHYCGQRSINLLTDLTNYLMLEMGQPMHAFDASKVDRIELMKFEHDIKFVTLDSVERSVPAGTLMICSGKKPVCIAGVMGGLDSGIEAETSSLLLESACFSAYDVRRASAAVGIRTDSSQRYEKSLDPEMTPVAVSRYLKLLGDIDPEIKIVSCLTDEIIHPAEKISTVVEKAFIEKYIGASFSLEKAKELITPLGFDVEIQNDTLVVGIPSWRATKDVSMSADIVEEIVRMYGFGNIEPKTTRSALFPVPKSVSKTDENAVKDLLVSRFGLHEIHSYIWQDADSLRDIALQAEPNIRLINSLNPNQTLLRNSLIPTLLITCNKNKSFAGSFGVFEIGKAYAGTDEKGLAVENKKLGIVLYSKEKDEKEVFFSLRDMLCALVSDIKNLKIGFEKTDASQSWQHPVNTFSVRCNGKSIGTLCTIPAKTTTKINKKSSIAAAEIDMEMLSSLAPAPLKYTAPSKYPNILIDLTLSVSRDTLYSDLEPSWADMGGLLQKAYPIGEFESEDERSITVRLDFCSSERSLQKSELQPLIDNMLAYLAKKGIKLKA